MKETISLGLGVLLALSTSTAYAFVDESTSSILSDDGRVSVKLLSRAADETIMKRIEDNVSIQLRDFDKATDSLDYNIFVSELPMKRTIGNEKKYAMKVTASFKTPRKVLEGSDSYNKGSISGAAVAYMEWTDGEGLKNTIDAFYSNANMIEGNVIASQAAWGKFHNRREVTKSLGSATSFKFYPDFTAGHLHADYELNIDPDRYGADLAICIHPEIFD